MEDLLFAVYLVLLIIFGGDTAGTIYFAIQSQHWRSYFDTHHMAGDASWAYFIFIFLCYSAIFSSLTFITVIISSCLYGISSRGWSRRRSNPCCDLLSLVTVIIFWFSSSL
jgi:hypothetical protein